MRQRREVIPQVEPVHVLQHADAALGQHRDATDTLAAEGHEGLVCEILVEGLKVQEHGAVDAGFEDEPARVDGGGRVVAQAGGEEGPDGTGPGEEEASNTVGQ